MKGFTRYDPALDEYWEWVFAALLVLVPFDLFTTVYAATVVGVEYESNPFMSWLLTQPIPVIVAVHILVTILVAGIFEVYHRLSLRSSQYGTIMLKAAKVYLALLVSVGLIVFANNIAVIFFHETIPMFNMP